MNEMMQAFRKYFRVVPADTPELVQAACRLRYAVYCEEARVPGFDKTCYPEGLEIDPDDSRSVHSLLYHVPSGRCAGTVRLICAGLGEKRTLLPVEEVAGRRDFPQLLRGRDALPRGSLAEISRLVVAPEFRSRCGERLRPDGVTENIGIPEGQDQRQFPHTVLGLLVAVFWMSRSHGIGYWYAWMDPVLARLLGRFGILFRAIGPSMDYHGLRRPYLGAVREIMAGMYYRRRDVWELFTDGVRSWDPPRRPERAVMGGD